MFTSDSLFEYAFKSNGPRDLLIVSYFLFPSASLPSHLEVAFLFTRISSLCPCFFSLQCTSLIFYYQVNFLPSLRRSVHSSRDYQNDLIRFILHWHLFNLFSRIRRTQINSIDIQWLILASIKWKPLDYDRKVGGCFRERTQNLHREEEQNRVHARITLSGRFMVVW